MLCAMLLILMISFNACKIQNKGGPVLTNDDNCVTCLIDGARTVVFADSYRDRRKSMKEIADSVLSGKLRDGTYYVSKAWYDGKGFYCNSFIFFLSFEKLTEH